MTLASSCPARSSIARRSSSPARPMPQTVSSGVASTRRALPVAGSDPQLAVLHEFPAIALVGDAAGVVAPDSRVEVTDLAAETLVGVLFSCRQNLVSHLSVVEEQRPGAHHVLLDARVRDSAQGKTRFVTLREGTLGRMEEAQAAEVVERARGEIVEDAIEHRRATDTLEALRAEGVGEVVQSGRVGK